MYSFSEALLKDPYLFQSALNVARHWSKDDYPEDTGISYLTDGSVHFCIPADQVKEIVIDLATGMRNQKHVVLEKGEDGAFRGILPFDETFTGAANAFVTYDSIPVLCPFLQIIWSGNRQINMVEIPEPEAEYLMIRRETDHGMISQAHFYSEATGQMERCMVYTPAGYMTGTEEYPVLYLLNGGTDNETSWENVGKCSCILDNLIAEGKAIPFIAVTFNTMLRKNGSVSAVRDHTCTNQLINDLIPYIESHFRAKKGKENRAIGGLSMGAYLTCDIAFGNPEVFGYMGTFTASMSQTPEQIEEQYTAGGIIRPYHEFLKNVSREQFADIFRVYFRSTTPQEDHLELFEADDALLHQAGYDTLPCYHRVLYSERTSKWNSWRMGLRDYAQLIFKD